MNGTFLLVDDDDAFRLLLSLAMEKISCPAKLQYVSSGEGAIRYLSRKGLYADDTQFPWPSLVLLDLKMPGMSGFDVLEWSSNQPQLKSLPFVIWSSSDQPEDKQRAFKLGARAYHCKPMDTKEFSKIILQLESIVLDLNSVGKSP